MRIPEEEHKVIPEKLVNSNLLTRKLKHILLTIKVLLGNLSVPLKKI
jgi:hypothetical protein